MVPGNSGIGRSRMNSIAQTAEKLIMNINNEPVLSTGGRDFAREFKKVIYTTQSTNEHPFTDSQTNESRIFVLYF